ncbi:hypothetical protein OSTOST_18262 [Ostertagia ostertagi]
MAPAPVAFATGGAVAPSPQLMIRRNFPETWLWLDHFSNDILQIGQVPFIHTHDCFILNHFRPSCISNDGNTLTYRTSNAVSGKMVFWWDFGFGGGGGMFEGNFAVMDLAGPPLPPMAGPPPPPPSPSAPVTAEIQIRSEFPETWIWVSFDAE